MLSHYNWDWDHNWDDEFSLEKTEWSEVIYNFRTKQVSSLNNVPLNKTIRFMPMVLIVTFDNEYIPPQIKFVRDLHIFAFDYERFYHDSPFFMTTLSQQVRIIFTGYRESRKKIILKMRVHSTDGYEYQNQIGLNDGIIISNGSEKIYKYSVLRIVESVTRFNSNKKKQNIL